MVFRLPRDDSTDYIKRVVGLPGDKIQMIDGQLHINGTAVQRERAEDFALAEDGAPAKPVKRWKETLPNGVSYYTLDLVDNSFYDNTPAYAVPPDHYFMLGDNRDNSTDSRVLSQVGYVPIDHLVGRAATIFFSIGGEAGALGPRVQSGEIKRQPRGPAGAAGAVRRAVGSRFFSRHSSSVPRMPFGM